MGTKNKGKAFQPLAKPVRKQSATPESQSPVQAQQPPTDATTGIGGKPVQAVTGSMASNPATIRKGVYLSALIYVEGDQAPADDFNSLTISSLKKDLGEHFAIPRDGLTMTLKSVDVQNNVEDGSDGGGGQDGEKQEEKFQF